MNEKIENNEELIQSLVKLDAKFDRIISLREPLEKVQALYINQAIHGGVDSKVQTLAQQYVDIGEGNFARNWRELVAMDMAFFDEEWLKLEEDPDGTSEQILMDVLSDYLMKSYQNNHSNFLQAMLFAKLQSKLLGIGGIAYSFCSKYKEKYKRQFDKKTTQLKRGEKTEDKLVYQGAKAEWLDIRNTYIDTLSPVSTQINDKDVFHRAGINADELLDDETYQEDEEYYFDDFCHYRGNDGLKELADNKPTYTLGYLERETKYKNTEITQFENHIELRIANLKRFKVGDKTYRNVTVRWAKNGNKPIPLLIEENRFCGQRPFLLFTEWVNPFDDYGKTQLGFNYNASEWSNFLRSAQAMAVIKALYGAKLIPEEVVSSISEATGNSIDDVEKLLLNHPDTLGKTYKYKAAELNSISLTPQNALIDLGKTEASQIIPLIQNERAQLQSEMQDNVIDLGSSDVSGSTAKGVGYIQDKQAFLAKQNLRELSQSVLIPFAEMTIQDLAAMFTTINHSYKLSESEKKELQELNPELQFIKGKMGQATVRDFEQAIQLGDNPQKYLKTKLNTKTGEIVVELTAEAWESFAGQVRVLIENNQYSRQEQERWADKLTQLTATLPEDLSEMKAKMTTDLTIEYMKLGKFTSRRDYDKYLENGNIEQMSQMKQAQEQMFLQKEQAEVNKINAQATKADAEAKEEASRAMKQMRENEDAEAIKQIAESEANAIV